jgi:hypothetical protein
MNLMALNSCIANYHAYYLNTMIYRKIRLPRLSGRNPGETPQHLPFRPGTFSRAWFPSWRVPMQDAGKGPSLLMNLCMRRGREPEMEGAEMDDFLKNTAIYEPWRYSRDFRGMSGEISPHREETVWPRQTGPGATAGWLWRKTDQVVREAGGMKMRDPGPTGSGSGSPGLDP